MQFRPTSNIFPNSVIIKLMTTQNGLYKLSIEVNRFFINSQHAEFHIHFALLQV